MQIALFFSIRLVTGMRVCVQFDHDSLIRQGANISPASYKSLDGVDLLPFYPTPSSPSSLPAGPPLTFVIDTHTLLVLIHPAAGLTK